MIYSHDAWASERQWEWDSATWRTLDDGVSPIREVWLSLPSQFFEAADCLVLLRACRKHAPKRKLRLLTEYGTAADAHGRDFRAETAKLRVELIDPQRKKFSPWLRDPFHFVRTTAGERVVFCRPNVQPGRENDSRAAELMVSGAMTRWAQMPITFHGGSLVHTPEATWISAHSVQECALEKLGRKSLSVATYQRAEPWRHYTRAVDEAVHELEELCRRPIRFVHRWPVQPGAAGHPEFVVTFAGGSGFDLDTLLTILPTGSVALVGDPFLGGRLLPAVSDREFVQFARRFGIATGAHRLRAELLRYQEGPPVPRLGEFLEMVARHLEETGMRVLRTPLLLIPTGLIVDRKGFGDMAPRNHFPLGFSNVVLERRARKGLCAEGFSSGLATLDRAARAAFAEAGCDLTLYPPLAESMICEGGYRCATQEIRASSDD